MLPLGDRHRPRQGRSSLRPAGRLEPEARRSRKLGRAILTARAGSCDDFAACDLPSELAQPAWYYRYQWWLVSRAWSDYLASGRLGQYLYVEPARSIVIVRLGRSLGGLSHRQWRALLVDVARRVP